MKPFFLILVLCALFLSTFLAAEADLLMYKAQFKVKDQSISQDSLDKLTTRVSHRCASLNASGAVTESKGLVTALWLSDQGSHCTSDDLISNLVEVGVQEYNISVVSAPVVAENYVQKDCTRTNSLGQVHITCMSCKVTDCQYQWNSSTALLITPVLIAAILAVAVF
jgi:hypothetical protein